MTTEPSRSLQAAPHTRKIARALAGSIESIGLPNLIGLAIASAQLTLLFRGEHIDAGIAAALVWMAGAVLLADLADPTPPSRGPLAGAPRWLALAALLWCLLVLTFTARLYDILLYPIPLVCLMALALLAGAELRSRTLRDLILIGGLLPFQRIVEGIFPIEPIIIQTTRMACLGLWGLGRDCVAMGNQLAMPEQTLKVDPPCAGVETLLLALISSLVFLILFPLPRPWHRLAALFLSSLLMAFGLNVVRVVVLSLSSKACDRSWWTFYCGFDFWHVGTGSHLFPLLAVSGVCALWWWDIQRHAIPDGTPPPQGSQP